MRKRADGGLERNHWNDTITTLKGDLLQRWEWGMFKARHDWHVERLYASEGNSQALAQILFRRRGPFSIAYIPRGPSFSPDTAALEALLQQIDACCRRYRTIMLYVDPISPLPIEWIEQQRGFNPGPVSIQTTRTIKTRLGNDDFLISQMRKDTRQNLNHALRNGVTARRMNPLAENRDAFYRLMQETGERQGFGIHTKEYYDDFLSIMGDSATMIFTERDGQVSHAIIAARSGTEGRSMYSGSSGTLRGRGDGVLLRFAAMQWARDLGCEEYDLGGIAPGPRETGSDSESTLLGVDAFKLGFGGIVVTYPDTLERCYRPQLASILRRIYPRFRLGGALESGQS